jgi:hypothetical protein
VSAQTAKQKPWDLVPEPNAETGSAAEFSTYYLAQAAAAMGLVNETMRPAFDGEPNMTAMLDYTDAIMDFVHLFAIGKLLRQVDDDAARELASWLEAGEQADEWTWQWLSEAGVDPELIDRLPTRQERAEHYERRRAERKAVVEAQP